MVEVFSSAPPTMQAPRLCSWEERSSDKDRWFKVFNHAWRALKQTEKQRESGPCDMLVCLLCHVKEPCNYTSPLSTFTTSDPWLPACCFKPRFTADSQQVYVRLPVPTSEILWKRLALQLCIITFQHKTLNDNKFYLRTGQKRCTTLKVEAWIHCGPVV